VKKLNTLDHWDIWNWITFQWVRTHNLKNIDIQIPKNKIVTITGVSWSGKSSLAFDTIYKEWQFRYIESLSSYLRQFFNLWERPDIDYCSWLSPAIAIEQNKKAGNSRSSVGTLTEIDDYLRLLFAKLGDSYCRSCGKEIKPQTIEWIMKEIEKKYIKQKIYLLQESGSFKTKEDLLEFVKKNRNKVEKWKWFTRYLLVSSPQSVVDSEKNESKKLKTKGQWPRHAEDRLKTDLEPIEYFYLETPNVPDEYFPLDAFGIYDRVTVEEKKLARLKEDIIKILGETKKFWAYIESWKKIKKGWDGIERFTDKMYCAECNVVYPEFTPQHFSPNRQEWACGHCHGIWEILQVDMDKILDPMSSYLKAILPWRDSVFGQVVLKKIAEKYSIDTDRIWKDLPEWFQHVVIFGDQELIRVNTWNKYTSLYYKWIEEIIKEQYARWLLTVDFQAMLDMKWCPECEWKKLRKESLNVFIDVKGDWETKGGYGDKKKNKFWNFEKSKFNIASLQNLPLAKLVELLQSYQKSSNKDKNLINRITNPLIDRVKTISDLWLGYLALNRTIDTLSGWEVQRLRLAKQLGNKLTWIVYVLDEPTIGLDDVEIKKAIVAIQKLREIWNTIIVVEHNEEFIKASDRVVEIGPWAGDFGWKLLFNWPYSEFLDSNTLTAQYIKWKRKIGIDFEHKPMNKFIKIRKAAKYNLKSIDVNIRLGSFTIITWPSGAGKTTLMYTTLYKFLNDREKFVQSYIRLQLLKKWLGREEIISAPVMRRDEYASYENLAMQEFYKELQVDTIQWTEEVKNTIYVDQTNIGKTPRSCPATFVNVFDKIRQVYANTTDAKYMWFTAGYFSFNSDKWACGACQWYGYKKIELQFLPDTYIPCELCNSKRYKTEILWIKWRGKNISEILGMYVSDALEFFKEMSTIKEELQLMVDIWLGYLRMWQPAHTLSGWESQRLKLVKHLLKSYKWHTIYFLDEPTVGLHLADIEKLLMVLREFLNKWDTILMIEHDKNILRFADDIISLDQGKLVNSF